MKSDPPLAVWMTLLFSSHDHMSRRAPGLSTRTKCWIPRHGLLKALGS